MNEKQYEQSLEIDKPKTKKKNTFIGIKSKLSTKAII